MPSSSATSPRDRRRRAVLRLVAGARVHSQAELAELLADEGIEANQATLSRDLRDLGVVKGPDGYEPPRADARAASDAAARLVQVLRQYLDGVAPAQNLVVLRTPPGGAQPLARAMDEVEPDDVLGTLAGDDTVLVVTHDARAARRVARWLEGQA